MFFKKMREQTKVIIIIVCVAFIGGALYVGGTSLFGGGQQQVAQAAVATVNGQGISYYDLQQAFISQLQQTEQQQGRVEGRMFESIRYQALNSMIGSILINQEIENRKIQVSSSDVNVKLQEIKDQFPDDEAYRSQLQMIGLTEDLLKQYLEDDLKVEKLREQVAGDISIPLEAIAEEYEAVEVSHILVRPEGSDEEAWAAVEKRAQEIFAQATADNFADLATAHSEDSGSAQEGGSIGFITRGETVPEFEEAAFSLPLSQVSEPVRSDFGYHILLVTDKRVAEGEEFEAARVEIEERLKAEKGQEALMDWFDEIREGADVVLNDFQMVAFENVVNENYDDAIHYYNLAIEESPQDGYLYASLGDTYRRLEQNAEALEQYEKATERVTNDPALFRVLGDLYQQNEQEDQAVSALLKASEMSPNDIYLQIDVYSRLTAMERVDEAKIVEDRVSEYQKRQEELRALQEGQQVAEEEAAGEETAGEEEASVEE